MSSRQLALLLTPVALGDVSVDTRLRGTSEIFLDLEDALTYTDMM